MILKSVSNTELIGNKIPNVYLRSVEKYGNIVKFHLIMKDMLDDNNNFMWFDDSLLMNGLTLNVKYGEEPKPIQYSLSYLTFKYKDIKTQQINKTLNNVFYFEHELILNQDVNLEIYLSFKDLESKKVYYSSATPSYVLLDNLNELFVGKPIKYLNNFYDSVTGQQLLKQNTSQYVKKDLNVFKMLEFNSALPTVNEKTFGDLFVSYKHDNSASGIFTINVESILSKSNSYLYFSRNTQLKDYLLKNSYIKNIKVYRQKLLGFESKEDKSKILVAQSSDDTTGFFNNVDNESFSFREIDFLSGLKENERCFVFADKQAKNLREGNYFYSVEIEYVDISNKILNYDKDSLTSKLSSNINIIKRYQKQLIANKTVGSSFVKDSYFEGEFQTIKDQLAQAIADIGSVMALLMAVEAPTLIQQLNSCLHPLSTNLELVEYLLNYFENSLDQINKLRDRIENIDTKTIELSSSTKTINVSKTYLDFNLTRNRKYIKSNKILSIPKVKDSGVEFLSLVNLLGRKSSVEDMYTLTVEDFNERVNLETLKYFTIPPLNQPSVFSFSPSFIDIKNNSYDFINTTQDGQQANFNFNNAVCDIQRINEQYVDFPKLESYIYELGSQYGVSFTNIANKVGVTKNKQKNSVLFDINQETKNSSQQYIVSTNVEKFYSFLNVPVNEPSASSDTIQGVSLTLNNSKYSKATRDVDLTDDLNNARYNLLFDTLATFKQYNQNGFNDNLSTVESINANYILCKLENNVKYRDVNVYNEYFLIKTNNNKLKEKPKLLIAETNKDFSEYSILPEAIFTSDTVDSYVVEGQVTAGTVARIQTDKDKINEIIKSI